ncbi:DUF3800 domain-containing protein [Marinicauda salina]|uniref:DUF3800 domain-containing protein n=1 Tax=Marinicauda salina TaxID=2135793 RepID=UPI001304EDE8|nr:DUF3800 domain-containing protein [Marinicauda salina]
MPVLCYLDDSYVEGGKVTALAGYYAPNDNWAAYEREAAEIYRDFGIETLHTNRFHNCRDDFEGWSFEYRDAFLTQLFGAAKDNNIAGVSFCITGNVVRDFKRASKKTAQFSALGMLFGMLTTTVCDNIGLLELSGPRNVSFFIESGNKNNRNISNIYKSLRNEGKMQLVDELEFIQKHECLAIQLADFWAYYSRRYASKAIQTGLSENFEPGSVIDKMCAAAFASCPHIIKIFTGPVTCPIDNPNLLSIGDPKSYYFGPSCR